MANNVYIGNRYVPLFDGDWVNNKTYDPLTIVSYGNNSYTSKKPVPLNTPPVSGGNDDPYWALTGNYNGQISNLQSRVSTLESNTADLPAIRADISDITSNRYGRVIFIGDSYANTSGFFTDAATMMGVSSRSTIKFLGATGFSVDASGYSGNNGFLRLLTEAVATLSDAQKAEVTDVIVCGGYNDAASFPNSAKIAAVEQGITNFKNYVDANLPNAKISIAMIGYAAEGYGSGTPHNIDELLFTEYMYMYTCNSLNIRYLTSPKYAMANTYYGSMDAYLDSDGVHPKSGAAHFIARALVNAMNNNDRLTTLPTMFSQATITSADGSWSSTLNMDYQVIGEELTIRWYARSIGCNLTVETQRRIKVASFTLPRACWFNHEHVAFMSELAIVGTSRAQASIQFEFVDGTNRCDVYMITPNGGNLTLFNVPYGEITMNMYAK